MSDHEDRTPLTVKIVLRQALRRIQEERNSFSQYEALAGNLGWEEVAEKASMVREALSAAADKAADAVEAAVKVQAESVLEHAHSHQHEHLHSHPHSHVHEHGDEHND